MKNLFLLFILLMPYFALGQEKEQLITIRPPKSISEPLFIIDGTRVDNDSIIIDLCKIESLPILKDKAEAYVYNRTGPFVIAIKMKEPVEHHVQVVADGFYSFLAAQPSKNFTLKSC